jgi:hypothetical protein
MLVKVYLKILISGAWQLDYFEENSLNAHFLLL